MPPPYRAAIVTVSDSVAQSTREDLSGPAVRRVLEGAGWTIKSTEVLPDDFSLIRERLGALTSDVDVDAVFTTGGTGVSPRDRTPEATLAVVDRLVPGLPEAMRASGRALNPHAMLSRAAAGIRGRTLIVNLPGSPRGAVESLKVILPALPHAAQLLRGDVGSESGHAPPRRRHQA